ncbi:MAG: hypothetical protein H6912_01230 [Kordiimonadaceae bacterium]|nr:hypothetical protein [Kordiimonadaceae bacterium]
MALIDQIRFWFGFLPKNAKPRMALLEQCCVDAVFKSGIDQPILFKNNMSAMIAWWAIPYYIYLFQLFEKHEITPQLIHKISKILSAHAQKQMGFNPESKEDNYDEISAALDTLIFEMCRLWEAIFREYYDHYDFFEYHQMSAYLESVFTNSELGIAERLWLRFETEEEVEEFKRMAEEDGEEFIDYTEDFTDCITRFYLYCMENKESLKN